MANSHKAVFGGRLREWRFPHKMADERIKTLRVVSKNAWPHARRVARLWMASIAYMPIAYLTSCGSVPRVDSDEIQPSVQ